MSSISRSTTSGVAAIILGLAVRSTLSHVSSGIVLSNVSSPSRVHGVTVTVQLDAKASPSTGCEILKNATLNFRLIVRAPAPTVTIKSITATYTESI
jgi:hypothetical protein